MSALLNPFKLTGRLFVAMVRITGYFMVFIIQMLWYLRLGRDAFGNIGDAFGDFGRGVTDALADILRD